jgi:hypothetical protein
VVGQRVIVFVPWKRRRRRPQEETTAEVFDDEAAVAVQTGIIGR